MVGKTLEQLDLRRTFRINLVAIKRTATGPEGTRVLKAFNPVPMPGEIIHLEDTLALVGSVLDLANFISEHS